MYTNEFLDTLIACPKTITGGLKSIPIRGGSVKKEFRMTSIDGVFSFKGFLSQNEKFQEDFSCGLVFEPKEEKGRICIIRVNGLHGGNTRIPHHAHCHEHRADADDINNGIKAERLIQEVKDYTTYEQGVLYFVKRINIIQQDRIKHFPPPKIQMPNLFDGLL